MSERELSDASLLGLAVSFIVALIAVIYGLLRRDISRNAKNIHELRNTVQSIAIKLATLMGKRRD